MKHDYIIDNKDALLKLVKALSSAEIYPLKITIDDAPPKTRTLTQNRALHLWLSQLAQTLNDAGLDMKRVLKTEVDIPWTQESAKEFLWRPIQQVMLSKKSTTEAETSEYNQVYETLSLHLMQKFSIPELPRWPSLETQLIESYKNTK